MPIGVAGNGDWPILFAMAARRVQLLRRFVLDSLFACMLGGRRVERAEIACARPHSASAQLEPGASSQQGVRVDELLVLLVAVSDRTALVQEDVQLGQIGRVDAVANHAFEHRNDSFGLELADKALDLLVRAVVGVGRFEIRAVVPICRCSCCCCAIRGRRSERHCRWFDVEDASVRVPGQIVRDVRDADERVVANETRKHVRRQTDNVDEAMIALLGHVYRLLEMLVQLNQQLLFADCLQLYDEQGVRAQLSLVRDKVDYVV